jgi:signal transduction histidine kinase
MISSEGAVFIGLLLLGTYQIRKTFRKENELAARQKNFLLSVTHELKSPIASAKLQLQTLQHRELTKTQQLEIIQNTISDTERLHQLVENILLAANIENNIFSLNRESIDLSAYLEENLRQTIGLFNYKQKIVLDIEKDIRMKIDRTSFPSIVLNLFENAVKYSDPGSTITIGLKKHREGVVLSVKDEGRGIPAEEKKNIFEKFYRIGNEETRKTKGTGLGLFIVKHLVELYGASITVKDNVPKGTVFEIIFE